MKGKVIREADPLQRLVRIGGAVAAGVGTLALLGWGVGLPLLASLGSGRKPMAPSTALLFVAYGIAVFLRARLPLSRGNYWTGVATASAGALVASVLLAASFLAPPGAKLLGLAITRAAGEAPAGQMSPVTAVCFLLASLSFLGSLPSASFRPWRAGAAWWSACLLLVTWCVLLLAYVYGAPLLYASSVVPPAATSGIAFVALGTALLVLAGPPGGAQDGPAGPRQRVPQALVLAFVLLAAGIVTVGALYSRGHQRHYRAEVARELTAIAELKTSELAQWRAERRGDASVFLENTAFASLAQRVFDNPQDAAAREELHRWLATIQAHYLYDRLSLLDARGAERLAVPERRTPVSSVTTRRVPDILRSGKVTFEDFHRNEHDGRVYLTVLVPILEGRGRGRALGVLALRIDPETYLYPFVSRWPTAAQTAETLLVRRDGNDALFLNELRFQKHTAVTLRIPLTSQDVPAVQAVLGHQGIVEGPDYRGVPVLAAVRPVPDSPWLLVARMDAAEVEAPLREQLWLTMLLVACLLAATAGGVGALWRQQRLRDLQERHQTERERAWLHDVIARSLNEIYVFDPGTLRFRFVNPGACRNLGYAPEELAGLTPLDVMPELAAEAFRARLQPLRTGERPLLVFETQHRRKDGSEYPVETHLQLVDGADGAVFLTIVNDITERRRADARIRQLNRVYAVLSDINQAIVREREPQLLFAEACRIAVEKGGFRLAWVGLLDSETKRVRPVAHAGVEEGYVEGLQVALGDATRGLGPTGQAQRLGLHAICNDIEHDPRMAPWRDDALARGYHASAAFPLVVGGETVGTFNLYAAETGFFDGEELGLLDELARDLSFALEMGRREEERRRSEEALRASETRYRAVTASAGEAIVTADSAGNIVGWNRSAEAVFGYTEAEASGQPLTLLMPQGFRERHLAGVERVRAGGERRLIGTTAEVEGLRKDGSVFPLELSLTQWETAEGRFYTGILRDISERKRGEAILRESQRLLLASQRVGRLGTHILDVGAGIWSSSETLDEIFGIDSHYPRTVDGWRSLVHPEDRAETVDYLDRQVIGGRLRFDKEYRIIRQSDGAERWVHGLGDLELDPEGNPLRMIGTIQDVTERRRLESQVRQSHKMEAIGRLAGGVAHDFNNMLAVILGFAQLGLRKVDARDPLHHQLAAIVQAAEKSADLTRQLLAFARRQTVAPRVVDLNAAIGAVGKMLGRLIGEDIELREVPGEGLWGVRIDPTQLDQILVNLATNARDAIRDDGVITIETVNVTLDEEDSKTRPGSAPGEYVMLAVSDNGPGMDRVTQERIFEPFFTTKPEGKGTGLGLATVYGIVKQNGGLIYAYSEPGQGSTFKIYLPRFAGEQQPAVVEGKLGPLTGTETLLLVEDEPQLLELARQGLESLGYRILSAATPGDAMLLFERHAEEIRLLVTDVVMPGLNGKELKQRVEKLKPGLRTVFMSGYTPDMVAQRGILDEQAVFVQKPFTLETLAGKVREALDG